MYNSFSDSGFSVSGDIFKVQISKTINTTDTATFNALSKSGKLNFIEQLYCQRAAIALQTTYPNTDWSKFDKRQNRSNWQFNNNIHYRNNGNVLTTAKGDSALDYVNFSFRLSHDFIRTMVDRVGQAGFSVYGVNIKGIPPLSRNGANYRFNIGHTTLYVMGEEEHFSYFLHEFCHSIFTREHYMGANTSSGDHFYISYGWGIMSEIYRFFLTANAWKKWFLGWMNSQRAKPNQTVYVLKDFVTANDALRIPIPLKSICFFICCNILWFGNNRKTSCRWFTCQNEFVAC